MSIESTQRSAEFATAEVQASWTAELRAWLQESSREAGFDVAGIAAVAEPHGSQATEEAQRFSAWVDAGRAGEMEYLKRRDEAGTLVRSGLRVAMPWARSVIVCALDYSYSDHSAGAEASKSIDPAEAGAGWIARYAWSGRTLDDGSMVPTDYHNELLGRLRKIEAALHERADCLTRCYVDTGPVLERSFAAQAGVGWIGKNTCVINQQLGSWLLLGVIVTSLPVLVAGEPALLASLPAPDRCGTCTRCIDACPTGALLGSRSPAAPREMDASLCIAYLTIEKKGAIPEPLRAPIGRQVFGCDICQDVCPWNNRPHRAPIAAKTASHEGMSPRAELINPALDWLAAMDSREFKRRFKGSPLERTGRKRLLRNVAIAMGNSGDARFLPQLEAWAPEGGGDPSNSTAQQDPVLREAAEWARAQIQKPLDSKIISRD